MTPRVTLVLAAIWLGTSPAGCDRDAADDAGSRTVTAAPDADRRIITEPPVPPGYPDIDPLVAASVGRALEGVNGDATSADAWLTLGMVYEANWYPGLAETCYSCASALDPRLPRAWFRLAATRADQSDPKGAIEAMRKAAEQAPFSAPAQWRLGLLYLDAGDGAAAAAAFTRASEMNPRETPAWFGLVRAHLLQDDGPAAEKIAKDHLLRGPYAAYGRYLLAQAYASQGRDDDYRKEIVRATSTPPPWRDAWTDEMLRFRTGLEPMRLNAMTRIRAGRPADAIVIVEQLLGYWPEDRQLRNTLALAHARTGEFNRARDILQDTLGMAPDDHTTLLMLGRVSYIASDTPDDAREALGYVDQSLAISPTYAPALELKGTLHFRLDEYEPAAAAYLAAVNADARKAPLLIEVARCHIALRDWEAAADACRDAIRRDDTLGEAHLGLAIALMELGEYDASAAALDAAGARIPSTDPAYRVLYRRRTELARRRAETGP